MNNTTVAKNEKGNTTTWFQCSRCPIETDRGINVRVDGVSMTLCKDCYKDLLENRCTGKKGTAATARRGG